MMERVDTRPCAGYVRISMEKRHHEDASVEMQKQMILEKAARDGKTVERFYEDVKSGKDNRRTGLQALLDDCRDGRYQKVYFYDLSRLTRSVPHSYEIWIALESGRCAWDSLGDQIDPTTIMGEFQRDLKVLLNQLERRQTAKRVKDATTSMVREGRWAGGNVNYGYAHPKRGVLVVDEEKRKVLLDIMGWYADGEAIIEIARRLNEAGVPRPGKAKVWHRSTIRQMLKNVAYGGIQQFSDQRGPWPFPRLVPEELFRRVQRRLESDAFRSGPNVPSHPWQKKVRCGVCGLSARRRTATRRKDGGKMIYYRCEHTKDPALPPVVDEPFVSIREEVFDGITRILLELTGDVEPPQKRYRPRGDDAAMDDLRDRMKDLNWAMFEARSISREYYLAKHREISAQMDRITPATLSRPGVRAVRSLRDRWGEMTLKERSDEIDELVREAVILPGEVYVVLMDWGWAGWPATIKVSAPGYVYGAAGRQYAPGAFENLSWEASDEPLEILLREG